jgi:RNA polymerase sigma-70 factor (ECF subfamily)
VEDPDLIERLKAGNRDAFNELVDCYANKVINTCYRFLLDRHDAEDISQEVFIEVFQSVRSFKGEAKLSTWIYRIAVTKSLDEIKRRNRKKNISSIGKILHLDEIAHWLSGGSMPDRSLNENERLMDVYRALNKLPDNQRIAFTLSRIDGYSNNEIAEIMKTTTVAVESLIYRAKKSVTAELEKILKK